MNKKNVEKAREYLKLNGALSVPFLQNKLRLSAKAADKIVKYLK